MSVVVVCNFCYKSTTCIYSSFMFFSSSVFFFHSWIVVAFSSIVNREQKKNFSSGFFSRTLLGLISQFFLSLAIAKIDNIISIFSFMAWHII